MKGYSLGELLVVLALVSIIGSSALVYSSSWRQNTCYRQAAREIVGTLRLARSVAINRFREVEVDFDLDTNRYRMRIGDLPSGSNSWREIQGWSSLPSQVRLASTKNCSQFGDGDTSTPHYDTIQFNPDGTAGISGAMMGYYLCVLSGANQPQYAGAVISPTTGRAVVRRWDANKQAWR